MTQPQPTAMIRTTPQDFYVEELPAYLPSGTGEHLFVTFQKTNCTTEQATTDIAHILGADPRGVGYAGMKDRHAVTVQTASFHLPKLQAEKILETHVFEKIKILNVSRHGNKLKPGHLQANRFRIMLRELNDATQRHHVVSALQRIGTEGVANAFGPQRFGRDGSNPEYVFAWLRGQTKPPKNRHLQRLLFSSMQSLLFNEVLQERIHHNAWNQILEGDIAKKTDTGGLFEVTHDELAICMDRAKRGEIVPTGPMFGAKMKSPQGQPFDIETKIFTKYFDNPDALIPFRQLGEGTRRSLVLQVTDMKVDESATENSICVEFVLSKGGYATTVLSAACHVIDASKTHSSSDNTGFYSDDIL